jgi:hypothetical protein
MEGIGLSDILLEAGLIGSGSVTGVMTGKHYSRAMHCHKILLEALERLLFFNADSNEALSGSSTRVFSNSKESSGRSIIGLSSA